MKNSKKLRVLHITNWYPHIQNPAEALWIQRHIESLNPFCENDTLHIQVQPSTRFRFSKRRLSTGIQLMIWVPFNQWWLIECLTALILFYYIIRLRINSQYDLINFHIAYPLLTFWHFLKKFVKLPIVVTEHWSAYHFGFNVSTPSKLNRIKNIFFQKIHWIAVSQALANDIKEFSGNNNLPVAVVPNAVNTEIFRIDHEDRTTHNQFFMLGLWKNPKDPFTVMVAFKDFIEKNRDNDYMLRIGGYGDLWEAMKLLVRQHDLCNRIFFLGKLNASQIAKEMNNASAFLHCSSYETFSVVCVEALCCGTPVIASAVGGIVEYLGVKEGVLVSENTKENWSEAFEKFAYTGSFDRESIAHKARSLFDFKSVGKRYFEVLKETHAKRDNYISSHS